MPEMGKTIGWKPRVIGSGFGTVALGKRWERDNQGRDIVKKRTAHGLAAGCS